MPFVQSADLSEEDAERYMAVYHATINALTNTLVHLDREARTNPDPGLRPGFRAAALDANRQLMLVQAEMLAFIRGTSVLRPPSAVEVQTAQNLVADLAALVAASAKVAAILDFATKSAKAFDELTK